MQEIDEILSYPLSHIRTIGDVRALVRDIEPLGAAAETLRSGFVIQGTGTLGRELGRAALDAGLPLRGFADSAQAKWGTTVHDLPIVDPATVTDPLVVAVFHFTQPLADARTRGTVDVLTYYHLVLAFPDVFLPYWCLPHPRDLVSRASDPRVDQTLARIADEDSRAEFARQIAARCYIGVLDAETPFGTHDSEYFVGTLASVTEGDALLDIGAFDGDTARRFLDRSTSDSTRVIAVEPDSMNFAKLRDEATASGGRILPLHAIVADAPRVLPFEETGSAASHVAQGSTTLVAATTVDAISQAAEFNRVKMDVEGFESTVLTGAAQVIDDRRADWAIAAYHRPDDLIALPEFFPADYSVEVSSHAPRPWDSTIYLVRDRSERA